MCLGGGEGEGASGGADVAHVGAGFQLALHRLAPFVACAALPPPAAMHAELLSVQVQLRHE